MPLSDFDDDIGLDDEAFEILDKVELQLFKASPTSIAPFGASLLSWKVNVPSGPGIPPITVELDLHTVAKNGEQVVQPLGSSIYKLTARVRQVRKPLGSVRVTVDNSTCQVNSPVNSRSTVQAPINKEIGDDPNFYFRNSARTVATFSPGSIRIKLKIGRDLPLPDPEINIDASFGLTVRDGVLEATNEHIGISMGVPDWASLIPGFAFILTVLYEAFREEVQTKIHNAILDIVAVLNFNLTPQKGFRRQSVRIDDGNNGAGIIETTECPYGLLTKFAKISDVAVVK